MSFIQKCKRAMYALTSRKVMIVIGFIALFLLIWFGGPLISIADYTPLASVAARAILILAILLIYTLTKLLHLRKQNKRNESMAEELIEVDEGAGDEIQEEIKTLKARMVEAIELLKNAKLFNGRNIYQLPWYIMIGPPGAGKTNIINNSGLDFPLKDKLGTDLVHGVGGTRNCDWWFTNKAVIIDTAGRYTTQNSHALHDAKAWQGFLGLLRKYRPKRPINGVVISMGISELMNQTKTERNLHARAIKQRLQELQSQLGMTFPVYVILSKVDLIEGFREFFCELSDEECEQVWGVTFELDANSDNQMDAFNKEFHALISNLTTLLNRRLINEHDLTNRSKIFEFPKQLRVLQNVGYSFLKEIFTPNAYESLPIFRGVYLTSSTQEGVPSNLLNEQSTVKKDYINQTRSFFIKRLLEKVIFPEQNLASTNKHHEKQNKWLRISCLAVTSVVLLGLSISWYVSFSWNNELIGKTDNALSEYQALDQNTVDKANLIVLNQRFNMLKNFPVNQLEADDFEAYGFSKVEPLTEASQKAYIRSLKTYLEPYLLNALTSEMTEQADYLSYLYETLRCYLMFFEPEHYNNEDVLAWFSAYYERNLPGDVNFQTRAELFEHTKALLEHGFSESEIDHQAVRLARAELTKLPIAERAYQRLQADFIDSSIPPFKLTDIISYESAKQFSFQNSDSIMKSIPGLYTYNGYHGIFNVEKSKMLGNLMASSWVYGEEASGTYDISKADIEKKLEQKYFQDYIYYWRSFINELSLNEFNSPNEGVRVTDVLAGPETPIKNIITTVQKNVRLTKLPISENQKAAGKVAANAAEVAMHTKANRLKRYLPNEAPQFDIKLPGYQVEEAFSDILEIDEQQLEQIQASLRELNIYLNQLDRGGLLKSSVKNQLSGKSKPEFLSQLEFQSKGLPYPANNWLLNISQDTSNITRSSANRHLNEIWKSTVLREYNDAIVGRYPFVSTSSKEVNLKDFSDFFGPDGTIDSFFNTYIAPSVDTSKSPWRFEKNIGVSKSALEMFEKAAKIREVFFDGNSKTPRIEFGLKPLKLDQTVSSFMLEIDGQSMIYRHGPPKVKSIVWPGDVAQNKTRIVFTPPYGGRTINASYEGEWSLYRMLDDLQAKRAQTEKDLQLQFSLQGNNATVELLPKSIRHPFWNASIESFSCPTRL